MSEIRRPVALCLLLAVLLTAALALSACGRGTPPPSAAEVLASMQAAMRASAQALPDGRVYTRAVAPTDPAYLSDTLLSALYGEAARGLLSADAVAEGVAPINDAAIFLSESPHPCELAVFRCSDARGTATAAKLCRARLEAIRRAWAGTEHEELVERGAVVVEGAFVMLVVAEDPGRASKGEKNKE